MEKGKGVIQIGISLDVPQEVVIPIKKAQTIKSVFQGITVEEKEVALSLVKNVLSGASEIEAVWTFEYLFCKGFFLCDKRINPLEISNHSIYLFLRTISSFKKDNPSIIPDEFLMRRKNGETVLVMLSDELKGLFKL